LLRRFFRSRRDPAPFVDGLARRATADLPFDVTGRRTLDLGSGDGALARALTALGAEVLALDIDLRSLADDPFPQVRADGTCLPFADSAFSRVVCSNVLEHTPHPERVLDEIARVLEPGGRAWVSWTNWYSPWGGHAIAPLHYLGPERGLRAWTRLFGPPKGPNLPYRNLWPTHVGRMMRHAANLPDVRLIDVKPRYYPSQRWIVRVPGLREVAMWNCVLILERNG